MAGRNKHEIRFKDEKKRGKYGDISGLSARCSCGQWNHAPIFDHDWRARPKLYTAHGFHRTQVGFV